MPNIKIAVLEQDGVELGVETEMDLQTALDFVGRKQSTVMQYHIYGAVTTSRYLASFSNAAFGGLLSTVLYSGDTGGFASSAPFLAPFNGKITKAILVARGLSVSVNSRANPLYSRFLLGAVGWTNEGTTLATLDFIIPPATTVGAFNNSDVGSNLTTTLTPATPIPITEGQLLGLKYSFGSGSGFTSQIRDVIVAFRIEET